MISLILATKGHKIIEIQRFFESVKETNKKLYELIIVCQDEKGYLDSFKEKYLDYPISVFYSKSGLSLARNIGLKKAKGDYISFPDDDCVYTEQLIENIILFFNSRSEVEILSINCFDLTDSYKLPFVNIKEPKYLTYREIMKGVSSISIFHKKNEDILFDVDFGLGAKYQSSEEIDYVLRLMHNGYKLYFSDKYRVLHPDSRLMDYNKKKKRIRTYAVGHGAYFKKNMKLLGIIIIIEMVFLRPLLGVLYYGSIFKFELAALSYLTLLYRVKGFFKYNN